MKDVGIYVHIPFCEKKCPYCDFYSVVSTKTKQEAYTKAVKKALLLYKEQGICASTLYFGGGTPILMEVDLLGEMIQTCTDLFGVPNEITIEANPCTTTLEKLQQLKQKGVNRVSFGMQSAVVSELEVLGRSHTTQQVAQAVQWAKEAGISNISVDMMLGVPHQTMDTVAHTLRFVQELDITHVSAYMLKIEENTKFNSQEIKTMLPDEDLVCDIYLYVCNELEKMGFKQYEISNFAKEQAQSRHNLKYWLGHDYIGFGPAAHSLFNGQRFYYNRDLSEFIESNGCNRIFEPPDSEFSKADEYIMCNLRLSSGIDLKILENTFGILPNKILKKAEKFIKNGYVCQKGNNLCLSKKGFLISNTIIVNLIQ